MKSLEFRVLGVPAPKGSSRAMLRGGHAVNVPSGSDANKAALQSWGGAVRAAAVEAVRRAAGVDAFSGVWFGEVPLRVEIVFHMRRRKADFAKDGSLKAEIPRYHMVKPDIVKLARATEDEMIGIVFLDDAAIAEECLRKVYAVPGQEGAWIRIRELEEPCPKPKKK